MCLTEQTLGGALGRLLLAATLVAALLVTSLPPTADSHNAEVVPGEVAVKLARADDLRAAAADYRLDPVPIGQFGFHAIYCLRIRDSVETARRAQALAQDPAGRVGTPSRTAWGRLLATGGIPPGLGPWHVELHRAVGAGHARVRPDAQGDTWRRRAG